MRAPAPPPSPALTWRPLRAGDAPALREFAPGIPLSLDENLSIAAFDGSGAIAACAIVTLDLRLAHEHRAHLLGAVTSGYRRRGIGAYLLSWSEHAARHALRDDPRPAVMSIDVADAAPAAVALYERAGFTLAVAEDYMQRTLIDPPAHKFASRLTHEPWSEARALAFFVAYQDSFRVRPGFPNWSFDTWTQAMTSATGFAPEFSILVSEASTPVAFAMTAIDRATATGHVMQIGVTPPVRRQGIAGAILSHLMNVFADAGLATIALDVNVNNPEARALYESMAFRKMRCDQSFRKQVEVDHV